MKIAICSQSDNTQSNVDSRFGRAAYFAVYDESVDEWEFVENRQNLQASQGAGIQAAQTVIDFGVGVLIAANVGPKAMVALRADGISVFEADTAKTIQQTFDAYRSGQLTQLDQSNVEGHWA
jgi:predicted Fe-Mo cluster-binding NifX family protein